MTEGCRTIALHSDMGDPGDGVADDDTGRRQQRPGEDRGDHQGQADHRAGDMNMAGERPAVVT